jgi:hypothetical protein
VLGNLVVAGGYAMLPGMAARLVGDVEFHLAKETALQGLRPLLRLSRPTFKPNCLGWVGGSMLGKLLADGKGSATGAVTREEYMTSVEKCVHNSEEMIDQLRVPPVRLACTIKITATSATAHYSHHGHRPQPYARTKGKGS